MILRYFFVVIILICNNFFEIVKSDELISENNIEENLKEYSMLFNVASVENFRNFDTNCNKQLKVFKDAVKNRKSWALQMLDASGQEESGYMYANFIWSGSMTQCQNLNTFKSLNLKETQELSEDSIPPFEVDFISVLLNHNNTMQVQMNLPNNEHIIIGLCLPKTCKGPEIFEIVDKVLEDKKMAFMKYYPLELSVLRVKSLAKEDVQWTNHGIVISTLIFFALTIFLSIFGTLYDVYIRRPHLQKMEKINTSRTNGIRSTKMFGENAIWSKILLCYSIPSNVQFIFDTNTKSSDSMPFVHGLKTFGMIFIVFVHFSLYLSIGMRNILNCARFSTKWYFQLFYKSAFSVDTYFCLGGFLISYLFYKYQRDKSPLTLKKGVIIYMQMIVHRIIRLMPVYLITIGIVVSVSRYMEQSYPLFKMVDSAEEICPTYWWRNLLFITTWHPRSEMCITWTWYLSEDIQFYMVNCVLLLISTVHLKATINLIKLMILYSIGYTAWKSYSIGYIPTIDAQMKVEIMYYSFSIRMAPYFVGVLAGYYFNKWNGTLPLTKKGIRNGWLLFVINAIFLVHSLPSPNKASFLFNTFYVAVSRTLWGIGIAWMLLACLSGHGGIINKIMTCKAWIPFSRTTFCVYLTNVLIVNMQGFTGESPFHFVLSHQISYALGNISLCFLVGLIFSILCESPFIHLTKLLMNPKKEKTNHKEMNGESKINLKNGEPIKLLKRNSINNMNVTNNNNCKTR